MPCWAQWPGLKTALKCKWRPDPECINPSQPWGYKALLSEASAPTANAHPLFLQFLGIPPPHRSPHRFWSAKNQFHPLVLAGRVMFNQHHKGRGKPTDCSGPCERPESPSVSWFPFVVGGGDWHTVDFQCCVSFGCTAKGLSYTYVRIYFLKTLSLGGYYSILSLVPRGAQVLAGYAVSVLRDLLPRISKNLNISEKLHSKSQGWCQTIPVLKSNLGWYLLSSEQGAFTLKGSKNSNPGPCHTFREMNSLRRTMQIVECSLSHRRA